MDSLADKLGRVTMRGFSLRWRSDPRSARGGSWIAQVSNRGQYVRVQHRDAEKAVDLLTDLLTGINQHRPGPKYRWRTWKKLTSRMTRREW